jgi:ribosomal protein S18 acetylase RimI-like enzyme
MQALVSGRWTPDSTWHIGDLAWQRYQHTGREPDWPTALWTDGGELIGWGWVKLPGYLALACRPDRPEVADAIVTWFTEVATAPELTVEVLVEPHVAGALERAGFQAAADPAAHVGLVHPLTDLAPVRLPDGYTVRGMRTGHDDLHQRVAVHRSAFAPSRVTEESYSAVMATWPYRADLDRVVVAPDGRFGASCLIWYDEQAGVGELEPVGTHADFRRLGLASAACLSALHELRALGGRQAIVFSHDDPDKPQALALYHSLGFRDHARVVTYRHSRGSRTAPVRRLD